MRINVRRRTSALSMAAVAALALPLAACGGGGSGGDADSNSVTMWASMDQVVIDAYKKTLIPAAKKEGVDLTIQKVDNINQVLLAKIAANDAPDISTVPQPGVLQAVVDRNAAFPLDDVLDVDQLKTDMIPGTLDVGTYKDKLYGVMVGMGVKSIVLYPKGPWAAAGYEVPQSLDELQTLTNQIKSDGQGAPWCFGIGSGTATGWAATDWIEDLILHQAGPDTYQQWVDHEIPFTDDAVKTAGETMEEMLFTPGNINGTIKQAASTTFNDAVQPMNADESKPGCWMVHMGTFIIGQMQQKVIDNPDKYLGVFQFPPAEAGAENPVMIGGDTAMMLNDNEATKKVMKLIATPELNNEEAKTGNQLSPFKTFDSNLYPNELIKTVAGYANNAPVAVFDGSDAMPAAVGTGTFWKEMTAWISGSEDLDAALKNIDDSWPAS